jgi:hypothetical protein
MDIPVLTPLPISLTKPHHKPISYSSPSPSFSKAVKVPLEISENDIKEETGLAFVKQIQTRPNSAFIPTVAVIIGHRDPLPERITIGLLKVKGG